MFKATHRITSESKTGKQMLSQKRGYGNTPHNTPHVGKKQIAKMQKRFQLAQERAAKQLEVK